MALTDFDLFVKFIDFVNNTYSAHFFIKEFTDTLSEPDKQRVIYINNVRLMEKEAERVKTLEQLSRDTEKYLSDLVSKLPNLNEKESLQLFKEVLNNILEK